MFWSTTNVMFTYNIPNVKANIQIEKLSPKKKKSVQIVRKTLHLNLHSLQVAVLAQ